MNLFPKSLNVVRKTAHFKTRKMLQELSKMAEQTKEKGFETASMNV